MMRKSLNFTINQEKERNQVIIDISICKMK